MSWRIKWKFVLNIKKISLALQANQISQIHWRFEKISSKFWTWTLRFFVKGLNQTFPAWLLKSKSKYSQVKCKRTLWIFFLCIVFNIKSNYLSLPVTWLKRPVHLRSGYPGERRSCFHIIVIATLWVVLVSFVCGFLINFFHIQTFFFTSRV